MDFADLVFHLGNFALPALVLAVLLVPAGRWLVPGDASGRPAWWGQVLVNFGVGLGVLCLGLWWFGRDGKMATYATLVAASALAQWKPSARRRC